MHEPSALGAAPADSPTSSGAPSAMTLSKIEPNSRVGDQVFEAIRTAIVSGKLHAGHRLRIRELADELGTSVMPVREAIRRLEEVGLAEAVPYRGAVVKGFTYKELLDLYSVRRSLETEATVLGAGRLSKDDDAALEATFRAMADAVAAQDAIAYLAHDEDFLAILYAASGNAVLLDVIRSLWQRCRSYKIVGARRELESGDPSSLLTYQDQLLSAAKKRDADTAGRITAASLDAATERIEHALRGSGPSR